MGSTTWIEWADATVNIWTGCAKVSPACKHCYAETNSPVRVMQKRVGLKMWGATGFRYETAGWEAALRRLNRRERHMREQFGAEHVRRRVFVNSLSDTFEDWCGPVYRLEDGKPVVVAQSLDNVRARFFQVAEECAELDILLLTKRPKNVKYMAPPHWYIAKWPSHIWLGATVEDQEHADKRIPELLKVPAKVRFLSVEPLLGKVDLAKGEWLSPLWDAPSTWRGVSWVIVGGESGKGARPMHPDWVRSIRDQCVAAGVPFFFKQWGEWAPSPEIGLPYHFEDGDHAFRIGKKNAGRVLDGRTWDEVPR